MEKFTRKLAAVSLILLTVITLTSIAAYSVAARATPASGASLQQNSPLNISQHKMSQSELAQYQSSIGDYEKNRSSNQKIGRYGTGLSSPTESSLRSIAENSYLVEEISAQTSLSPSVDLSASPYFPPIGNQGNLGSCASFSVGYYCKTYQEAKEHNWDLSGATWVDTGVSAPYESMIMSPSFVYNLVNGGKDSGSDFGSPIRLVCNVGISSWKTMPYDATNYTQWPSKAAWAEAPLYRSNSTYNFQFLYANTTMGLESLKSWLAAGNLAIIAVDAYDNLWNYTSQSIVLNNRDILTTDTYINGPLDHAATIVGYDDSYSYSENGSTHQGAFKIANSWGIGGWENIPDGCYWISFNTMLAIANGEDPVMLFKNLENYQPQILATFNITHLDRGDCQITFGLGTPSAPVATKSFNSYISGGNHPFCTNNIVFDLTEFKQNMTSLYTQKFFMSIYDLGSQTGTVNYFAIANTNSTQTPTQTVIGHYVYLTLTTSFEAPTLTVSPSSGPAGGTITLNGVGFTVGSTLEIEYLNQQTSTWIPFANVSTGNGNLTYNASAPDLTQPNLAGDHIGASDYIVFRAKDNGVPYNATTPYVEWRRGLLQVNDQTAEWLFGNNTDLSAAAYVTSTQSMLLSGNWFSPGHASIYWDSIFLGDATVNQTGYFSTLVTVPFDALAGKHVLWVVDSGSNVSVTVTRLPKVSNNYIDEWHTADFRINITADYMGIQTVYRVNGGQICAIISEGQPTINISGSNNTLEYWSFWNVYGTGNLTLCNVKVMDIKLDKTLPSASFSINGGASQTASTSVMLTINANDSVSGMGRMRFSNDPLFSQATWEPYATSKNWQLTSGAGAKTVYFQVQDNAGHTTATNASIILNTIASISPTATPTQSAATQLTTQPTSQPSSAPTLTPTPTVPELSLLIVLLMLVLATTAVLFTSKLTNPLHQWC